MGARLKLCLMSHVEEANFTWNDTTPGGDRWAVRLGTLAHAIAMDGGHGTRGGKLSVQVDYGWLDQNNGDYPGGPTSLRTVLEKGGNLWVHNHDASLGHLRSSYMIVASAYASEVPGGPVAMSVATPMTAGRSAGADMDDPSIDWVANAVAVGIRFANSPAVNNYACTPESMRPYRMSATDMKGVYFHDAAPGPLYEGAPTTMRQRPFWVNSASQWDFKTSSTFPQEATVGSILMIPHPGRSDLAGLYEGRSAYTGDAGTITPDDLRAALTEVWSTYKQMETHQASISNVWYVHIPPGLLGQGAAGTSDVVNTIGAWVDSVNAMLNVPNSAVWMNMNEIASHYWEPQSAYW